MLEVASHCVCDEEAQLFAKKPLYGPIPAERQSGITAETTPQPGLSAGAPEHRARGNPILDFEVGVDLEFDVSFLVIDADVVMIITLQIGKD